MEVDTPSDDPSLDEGMTKGREQPPTFDPALLHSDDDDATAAGAAATTDEEEPDPHLRAPPVESEVLDDEDPRLREAFRRSLLSAKAQEIENRGQLS